MSDALHRFIQLDLLAIVCALCAAASCALLGNYLVLRRQSLMGDAISHSVLPGLVIAFIVSQSKDPIAMFVGALAAGVATAALIEFVRRAGRVEPHAAMGVVFSVFFALGVLLIERTSTRGVDLDADCVLHGQLENVAWWAAPTDPAAYLTLAPYLVPAADGGPPAQVWMLLVTLASAVVFVTVFFKELRLASFDPESASALGFSANLINYSLMVMVAAATVASFEAVGSILVIAMLICPALVARLFTDRMTTQLLASVVAAAVAVAFGYGGASAVPAWLGADFAVNAAGSIATALGVFVALACLFAPSHGVVAALLRRRALAARVAREDLLAALYRLREGGSTGATIAQLVRPPHTTDRFRAAASRLERSGMLLRRGEQFALTDRGIDAGASLIRRHRLVERYLVDVAGVRPDHVHPTAARLEHFEQIDEDAERDPAPTDPHGRPIPERPPHNAGEHRPGV
jgi:manganese/zinc/iron transport system permease protein